MKRDIVFEFLLKALVCFEWTVIIIWEILLAFYDTKEMESTAYKSVWTIALHSLSMFVEPATAYVCKLSLLLLFLNTCKIF